MGSTPSPHIGMEVWEFDDHIRVYEKNAQGRSAGGPIYKHKWAKRVILGETKVSWLVGPEHAQANPGPWSNKYPKKSFPPPSIKLSDAEVDQDCWVQANRWRIQERVGGVSDYTLLKLIEEAIDTHEASKS
jgi:hypothetical protein